MTRACAAGLVCWTGIALACSVADRCPGGAWVETGGGGVCVIAAPDSGAEEGGACPLRGHVEPAAPRFDGLRMVLGPATEIGESYYSSAGADLVAHRGALWWMETHDRCGRTDTRVWWGARTFRFRGDAEGRAVDLEAACEPWTYTVTNARLFASGDVLTLCTQGHAPYLYVGCGRLGDAPGLFEPVDELERPRSFIAGERSRGVILRWQHNETGEQGLRFYGADGALESAVGMPSTERLLEGVWVMELEGVPFLAASGSTGTPLVIERIGPATTLLPSIAIDGFRTDRALTPSSIAIRDGDSRLATFVLEPTGDTVRIHLVTLGSDASWGTRPVIDGVTRLVGAALDGRGQLFVLTHRVEETTRTARTELWRLACDGTRLEPPLTIDTLGATPRALGIEADGSRAWIAFSVHDGDDVQPDGVRPHFVHSVRSVRLP